MSKIDDIHNDVQEIKTCLMGNPDFKQTGLIHEVKKNSKYRKASAKRLGFISAIFTIFGGLIMYVKDFFGL